MQPSSVPTPVVAPQQPSGPSVVARPTKGGPRRGLLWLLAIVVLAAAGGWYWQQQARQGEEQAAAGAAKVALRTAPVAPGKVEATLRLTGTTGPENFVQITAPQLRGSRSFMGGRGMMTSRGGSSSGGSSGGSSGAAGGTVQSNAGQTNSSGGSSSVTAALSGGGSGGSGVRTSAGAMRAATSRVRESSRSSSSASSRASAAAASLGSEGLGSTSGSLFGSGGPSRGSGIGMGDFGTTLQQLVKPGTAVKKGDTMAEFDRQYMLLRLDDYRAGVVQQQASNRKRLAQLEVTRKAHEQSILEAKGAVEKAKLDLKTTPVRSAIDTERLRLALEEAEARHKQLLNEVQFVRIGEQAQLKMDELELKEQELELKRAEANAERMIVKAPIDGMTVMLQVFRGAEFGQVAVGDPIPSGMPFMQIVDTRSMVINAAVNQADVERIRVGAKARVRFDAFPDLELPAHVFSVAAMPRSTFSARASFLKEIPVRLKLDAMDPRVIPDLSVAVDVIVESEQAAAVVPLGSVFRDSPESRPYVFVSTPDGFQRREVELGLASFTQAAVRGGLRAGEVVAQERPAAAPDGSPPRKS